MANSVIDSKGRVWLPADVLEQLGIGGAMTAEVDGSCCLVGIRRKELVRRSGHYDQWRSEPGPGAPPIDAERRRPALAPLLEQGGEIQLEPRSRSGGEFVASAERPAFSAFVDVYRLALGIDDPDRFDAEAEIEFDLCPHLCAALAG